MDRRAILRRTKEQSMDATQMPKRLEEWQGKQISCRLLDGKHEMGQLTEMGDGWMVLMRTNGHAIILFHHALVSIEERPRSNA
jgi:hypothetical protein